MAVSDNTYFAPVLPDFSQFFGDVDKQSRKGGERAAKGFSEGVSKNLGRAEKAVEKYTKAQERAQDRVADAVGKTAIEQEKLNEVLEDSSSSVSKIRTATERYEKAQRDELRVKANAERVAKDLSDAQEQVAKATSEASDQFRMGQDDVDAYGRALDDAADKGGGFGNKLLGGLKVVGVGALLGVGSRMGNAVVDGIRGSFDSGFARLASVEQAEQMLSGLGHTTEATATIMDNAMNSVKGTAFGFGEAASMAATFVGAGIPEGAELERILSLVGDTAAITGSDLNEMGSIWTKVATGARLGTEEMNQLMDRGLGVLPELQKHYNVTADEARKMVTEGKVSFEDFGAIMENMVGGSAQAMGDTVSGSAANAQAALGRLGASILEPAFNAAPAIFQALGGGIDHLNEYLSPLIADWGERLTPYLEDFANNLGPWLESAIDNMAGAISTIVTVVGDWVTKFQELYDWGVANQGWLIPLIGSLTAMAATVITVVGAYQTFIKVQAAYTKALASYRVAVAAARAATIAFSTSLWANPMVWIAAAIIGVIAALVLFFTQTETGRAMWDTFTTALADGWSWVVDTFTAGVDWVKEKWSEFSTAIVNFWDTYIYPVFQAISKVVQTVFGVGFAVVIGSAMVMWNLLSAAIKAGWEKLILPAWQGLQKWMGLLWTAVFSPMLSWIGDKWNWLTGIITAVAGAIKARIDFMGAVISALWATYVSPILTWIGAKWDWVQGAISYAIDWVNYKIDYLGAVISALWEAYVSPILTWIGDKWDWLQSAMGAVIDYLSDVAFEKFKSAVDGVKNFFSDVVDGIGNKWDSLKKLLATPINFMINTVYNDGILRAWNIIAGILPGLEEGSPISGIAEYNAGGHVAGPGTGTSDDIPAWLSNGEHVWTAAEVARVGGQAGMYAMRNAVASGRGFTYDGQGGVATLPGRPDNRAGDLAGAAPELLGVQAYAKGGEVRPLWEAQLMRAHAFAQSQSGKPYQWAGPQGPGQSFDCSGFMGSIAAVIQGDDPWRRYWATGSFSGGNTAQGFVPGTGPGFSIGLFNGGPWGGHTAGTLSAAGQYGVANVESGGSPSMVKYGAGAGAVGADHGQFTHTYHLPIGADGAFVSGGAGGVSPESMRSIIAEKLEGAIDTVMSPIVDRLPTKPPEWQGIPRGVYDSGKDGLVNFVSDSIGALGDKLASVHTAVSGMTDLVRDAATGAWDWITDRVDVFDTGGVLRPGALAQNRSGHPELIINHAQLGAFNRLAGALGISAESMQVVTKEISEAYAGRDWGYAELARVLGNEQWALAIVNGAADIGHFVRTYGDVIGEVTEAANSHFMDEAANVAGLFGLEDLVGLSLPEEFSPGNLRAAYANANNLYNDPDYIHPDNIDDDDTPSATSAPVVTGVDDVNRVANTERTAPSETNAGEVVRITANSSDDFVKVSDIEELDGRVVRLEIDRDESAKVPAAAVTRGGAM